MHNYIDPGQTYAVSNGSVVCSTTLASTELASTTLAQLDSPVEDGIKVLAQIGREREQEREMQDG